MKKPIVALIYDFDGTLAPGNMQEFGFIQAMGTTKEEFWEKSNSLAVDQDASDVLAYMKMMYDEARAKGISLRREDFMRFGRDIDFFEGVRGWFKLVNDYGAAHGVRVEHYINSSGLKEMVEGTAIAKEFKHIFAGSYIYNEAGEAVWPGIAVDYTNKTQFLFKINKGIFSARDSKMVNASTAENKKRVPFSHMIYFGDGETDVPSMKIVGMFGGNPIAVFDPKNEKKRAVAAKLKRQGRVRFVAPAVYTPESKAYKLVCAIIDKIYADFVLQEFEK
ncbi:MAG: haloacid dehalogenase-like hydrolase [Bacteroidales bacterium]|nr:haloacid dehalogenase-like hydrolase [Bacteroidales bacterium]MBR3500581.1 haloacid dehalogenase-like hydrolase [Bacteroidales bacterium]